jgi:hypothetical protein
MESVVLNGGEVAQPLRYHMDTLKIWIGNLLIGAFASLFLFIVFPFVDKWGSNQPAGVRPAARAAIILILFFSELWASIAVLFDCHVPVNNFIIYYPIWMVPAGIGLILAVVKSNKVYRKTHGYNEVRSCSERIQLYPAEQILNVTRVRLFRGFEADGNSANLVVTTSRLIFEPAVGSNFQNSEEFLLSQISDGMAPNTLGFIPDRIILVLNNGNADLEFTVSWGRKSIIAAIKNAISGVAGKMSN